MQDENSINESNAVGEESTSEWQAPPPPEPPAETAEPPQMSQAATLTGIFFEPGKVFEDMRRKPRFLLAGLIVVIAITAFNTVFIQKIGFEKIVRSRLDSSSRIQQMSADQKAELIAQ